LQYDSFMKRDGRTLDHKTLEEIRRMAVQRVWDGERPSVVIASFGFSRQIIYKWLREAKGKGRGLRALRSRKGTGRPRRLAPKQEQQLFRWINGKDPRQHGFDFGMWTRLVVRKLIADKFGANLGVTAVGKLLAKLGLTPQKPLKRAYERDPAAIEAWKHDTYPSIAKRAKQQRAEIYFWDESGFRADAVQGQTWGMKGQTPIVAMPGQRQSVSAASAVNAKGSFWFATYKGGMSADLFIEMLKALMRHRKRPLFLILDSLPAHKAKVVKNYVASTEGKLELHFLPGYAPELNPDEMVWNHMKRTGTARSPLTQGESLHDRVDVELLQIQQNRALVRSFFRAETVSYISD
jgi:transposase